MDIEIKEEEKSVVCHALNVYLDELREEIGKTDSHEMKIDLQHEREVLKKFISQC